MSNLISIVMPVKNAGNYLQPCLDSILDQTDVDWELIAVDDHSNDGSSDVLCQFATNHSNVSILTNTGQGIIEALRTGYKHCKGDFITRMDADDVMPPLKLKMLYTIAKMEKVATGKVEYFSDEWMVGGGFKNYQAWLNNTMEKQSFWDDLYMECPLPSPAWMMPRTMFDEMGGFESDLLPEDYDLCFRVKQFGFEIEASLEVVHHWRDSQNRTSRKNPIYFPMAYYPLKVHYFLKLEHDPNRQLVLWGGGKKGKKLAALLREHGVNFRWVTNNIKKIGHEIEGVVLEPIPVLDAEKHHVILAVSAPDEKPAISQKLADDNLQKGVDYWWFC